MICITLNDLYYVEWIEPGWMVFTAVNHLYCVKWFALHGMTCTTLKDLCSVERFVLRWITPNAMDDLQIFKTLNHLDCDILVSIGFLTLKWLGGVNLNLLWCFEKCIFPENVIGMSQVVQKILRNSLSILAIFINFHRFFFYFFNISLLQRH